MEQIESKWIPEIRKKISLHKDPIILAGTNVELSNDFNNNDNSNSNTNSSVTTSGGIELAKRTGCLKYINVLLKTISTSKR